LLHKMMSNGKAIMKIFNGIVITVVGCLLFLPSVYADVSPGQVKEVEHLLEFVKTSDCVINRNATEYTGPEGVAHIQRKYEYYREDIETTEDFIRLSATKSTMSGKYYTVKCPGKVMINTQRWLLTELEFFRVEEKKRQLNKNKRK